MSADRGSALLLGLPTELRLHIIEILQEDGDRTSRIYCCDEHVGQDTLRAGHNTTHATARDEADDVLEACLELLPLSLTCKQLAIDVRDVLYNNRRFDFCLPSLSMPSIMYAGHTRALPCDFWHVGPDNSLRVPAFFKHLREVRITVDVSERAAQGVNGHLAYLEGIGNVSMVVEALTTVAKLRTFDCHVMVSGDDPASARFWVEEGWDCLRVLEALRTVEHLPDEVQLKIRIEHECSYELLIETLDPPEGTAEALYVQRLIGEARSSHFASTVPLSHAYRAFRGRIEDLGIPFDKFEYTCSSLWNTLESVGGYLEAELMALWAACCTGEEKELESCQRNFFLAWEYVVGQMNHAQSK